MIGKVAESRSFYFNHHEEVKMNELRETYITIEQYLFPVWEDEFFPLTGKQREFIRELELVRPGRFIGANLRWSGKGRPCSSREGVLRAFMAKGIYDFPTTKMLIENLKGDPHLRRLCGWEYPSQTYFLKESSPRLGITAFLYLTKSRN